MTDKDTELLQYLHQAAEMGRDNLLKMDSMVEDDMLRRSIERKILEYKSVYDQTARKLKEAGAELKGSAAMAKAMSSVMITAKTMMDNSPSHVAAMIIQGNTMGIIEGVKKLKDYAGCDDDAVNIAYKLLWVAETGIDEMKHFL